jgi:hypothetical protein
MPGSPPRGPSPGERRDHLRRHTLPFAAHDAVDRSTGLSEQLGRDERGAVPSHQHPAVGQAFLGEAREIDHLRDVGEVVEREAHDLGSPPGDPRLEMAALEDLEVEDVDLVARRLDRARHPLDAERLETQVDLGEEQRARVDEQYAHRTSSGALAS